MVMLALLTLLPLGAALNGAKPAGGDAARFGFASQCELEVTKFYCHIAPHDSFCKTGVIDQCLQMKDECHTFSSNFCSEDEKCCQCAFDDCPLEDEGCELLAKKCGDSSETKFQSHVEIAKISGVVRPGKIPIKINGACIGGGECLGSIRGAGAAAMGASYAV